jgi:hypothetical protein
MPARRFSPPWTAQVAPNCFIVRRVPHPARINYTTQMWRWDGDHYEKTFDYFDACGADDKHSFDAVRLFF